MRILDLRLRARLLANGRKQARSRARGVELDLAPVVKLFTPDANATWLLTEIDPRRCDLAFGLCDLGLGCPELGYVDLSELEALRGPLALPVERDRHFGAAGALSVYAKAAFAAGRIIA